MFRRLGVTILASAAYGFTCGLVHSFEFGARNLLKFPLLVVVTSAVCVLAYWVFAQFLTRALSFRSVQRLSLLTFHDMAVLLASLSPIGLFLALTVEKPLSEAELGEYPLFLALNVVFIALCGSVALVRQAHVLLRTHGLTSRRAVLVVLSWLAISLVAGGQCSWYFRPYFGLAFEEGVPFMLGSAPDFRGATSFYEAVYHLVAPP
ncbi:MAG: hypothetical protein ACYTDY_06825 [Planctomycetota bacterium]|jgi:hypothetical protein